MTGRYMKLVHSLEADIHARMEQQEMQIRDCLGRWVSEVDPELIRQAWSEGGSFLGLGQNGKLSVPVRGGPL